jgi:hypothetical protein
MFLVSSPHSTTHTTQHDTTRHDTHPHDTPLHSTSAAHSRVAAQALSTTQHRGGGSTEAAIGHTGAPEAARKGSGHGHKCTRRDTRTDAHSSSAASGAAQKGSSACVVASEAAHMPHGRAGGAARCARCPSSFSPFLSCLSFVLLLVALRGTGNSASPPARREARRKTVSPMHRGKWRTANRLVRSVCVCAASLGVFGECCHVGRFGSVGAL